MLPHHVCESRASLCPPEAYLLAAGVKSVPVSGVQSFLPTLTSWPRFILPYSVIGSYYCYYGCNYRSLIYSLKMLHLFHFALLFYWRIKFLWEILLIGWIRCHLCSLLAGCTSKQCHIELLPGNALPGLLSLSS